MSLGILVRREDATIASREPGFFLKERENCRGSCERYPNVAMTRGSTVDPPYPRKQQAS